MALFEAPKEPPKKVSYKKIKACVLNREANSNISDECKAVFREANVVDD